MIFNTSMDYDDELEEQEKRRRRKRARKHRPHVVTESSKHSRRNRIVALKRERVAEAKDSLKRHLGRFADIKTDQGKRQAQAYIQWVSSSLKKREPSVNLDDIHFQYSLSSKPGGQHVQKNRTSCKATHLPTMIGVRNEEERSSVQNKSNALKQLYERLVDHLRLWMIVSGGTQDRNTEEIVMEMLHESQ